MAMTRPWLIAIPISSTIAPATMPTSPTIARNRFVPLRSSMAVRKAAIGLVREARNAGTKAEITVTTTPTRRTSSTLVGRSRSATPADPVSALNCGTRSRSAKNNASPDGHTDRAGDAADDGGLEQHRSTDLLAAGADGSQQRELPQALGHHDRERVVDDEDADEQGDPGEDLQAGADDVGQRRRPMPASSERSSSPVCTVKRSPTWSDSATASASCEVPSVPVT